MSENSKPNSFEVANSGNNTQINSKNTKKESARNPFLVILGDARKTFKKQIIRDAQMKKSAIEHTLKINDLDRDDERKVFLGNFYDLVEYRLLDSNRFMNDCQRIGLIAFNAAQHVVFDGKTKLENVLAFGLEKTYGNDVLKMREPIFSKRELEEARITQKEVDDLETAA